VVFDLNSDEEIDHVELYTDDKLTRIAVNDDRIAFRIFDSQSDK